MSLSAVEQLLQQVSDTGNYSIIEQFIQPARPERTRSIPSGYMQPVFRKVFHEFGLPPNTVWLHQAEALDVIDNGMSAVLSTATASGKTLVFQLAALKKMIENPEARILAFYPTRALNNDQMLSWKRLLQAAELPTEQLALIDGSVPMAGRIEMLSKAKIAIMTPDVVHAWIMSNINDPVIQKFITNLQLKILDETHLYDGSFGTHFSYLLRRLKFAQSVLNPDYKESTHGQIIAASATMEEPEEFLKKLTGNDFYSIGPEMDGSPRYERSISLVGVPDFKQKDAAQKMLYSLGKQQDLPGTTICFVDSRTAVDEMADNVNFKLTGSERQQIFSSYRAGYNSEDREEIENEIRNGTVKGVIATSALEVGIDIKGIKQVVMVSMPDAAALRQRAGRIRTGGNIIIFEELSTIQNFKLSARQKMEEAPRQPILYRVNSKLIAEEAVCFLDEAEKLGVKKPIDMIKKKRVTWPKGFLPAVEQYLTLENDLPEELEKAIPPNGRSPQKYHSLRSFDGPSRRILIFDPKIGKFKTLGEVSQTQAISEYYPGAIRPVRGRKYRVTNWSKREGSDKSIFVRPANPEELADRLKTRGYVRTNIMTYLNDLRVQAKRLKRDSKGNFIADCKLTIVKKVSGFAEQRTSGMTRIFYGEPKNGLTHTFAQKNGMEVINTKDFGEARSHTYDTTGVVMRVSDRWFSKTTVRRIAKLLHRAVCEEFNVAPQDLGIATNNIRIGLNVEKHIEDRALIIFDKTPGSLYLSRKLFDHFPRVITRMIDQCENNEMEQWVYKLNDWYEGLRFKAAPTYKEFIQTHLPKVLPKNFRIVYKPGSLMEWKRSEKDKPVRVRIEKVELVEGSLVYAIREASYEYNPFLKKGERSENLGVRVKPANYLNTYFVNAAQLREPSAATFTFGVFDMMSKSMVDTATIKPMNDDKPQPKRAPG